MTTATLTKPTVTAQVTASKPKVKVSILANFNNYALIKLNSRCAYITGVNPAGKAFTQCAYIGFGSRESAQAFANKLGKKYVIREGDRLTTPVELKVWGLSDAQIKNIADNLVIPVTMAAKLLQGYDAQTGDYTDDLIATRVGTGLTEERFEAIITAEYPDWQIMSMWVVQDDKWF